MGSNTYKHITIQVLISHYLAALLESARGEQKTLQTENKKLQRTNKKNKESEYRTHSFGVLTYMRIGVRSGQRSK